jgi:hypothetical protein
MYTKGQVLFTLPDSPSVTRHEITDIVTVREESGREYLLYKLSGYGAWFTEEELDRDFSKLVLTKDGS